MPKLIVKALKLRYEMRTINIGLGSATSITPKPADNERIVANFALCTTQQ